MKKYNPNLYGQSYGIGSSDVWDVAYLNMGFPGAESGDLVGQANQLVSLLKLHSDVVNFFKAPKFPKMRIIYFDFQTALKDFDYLQKKFSVIFKNAAFPCLKSAVFLCLSSSKFLD